MSDYPLRAACIHGRYDQHNFDWNPDAGWQNCPGGPAVIIDYEAGWEQVPTSHPISASRFRYAVDAAIGDTE